MAVDPKRDKIITPANDWPEYRVYILNFLTRIEETQKKQSERIECLKDELLEMKREHSLYRKIVVGFAGLILIGFGSALVKVANTAMGLFGKP